MSEEKVQKVSHLKHILIRPDSYVGPTSKTSELCWIVDGDEFAQESLIYSPALLKIFDELLVNSIDRNTLYPTDVTYIKVTVDKETGLITVENNGPLGGIQVSLHEEENVYNPELTFGHLLTSTNYNDQKKNIVGGRNGYGAKLTNIYSSLFVVTIHDHVNGLKYVQQFESNMSKVNKPKISKYSGKVSKVNISFVPDWKRFGMDRLDEDFFKIVEKRVFDANYCTHAKCSVYFQGEKLKKCSNEEYVKMYLDENTKVCSASSDRWCVSVAPSDGFQQVSFVNGVCTTKGGTHVDYVSKMISDGIIEELAKKIKLKPQQVKNTFFVFVKCMLENPNFSSQVKSECTLKCQNFGSRFEPPKSFIKGVLKTGIQNEVLSLSKFREMKELKKSDGGKKNRITGIPKLDDANRAGTKDSAKCTIILTEGDSAKTLAVAGTSVVGRDYFGVYPLRGKCKNVRDASVKQLTVNQEFSDIKKILGLQQGKVYTSVSELRYGRLMIMADQDHDGSHIKGLVLNMIHVFWPSLIELGFVVSMVTPILKLSKGSKVLSFYTETAFKTWTEQNSSSGWKLKYYKGLGTSTTSEAKEYFKQIQKLTVKFTSDEETDEAMLLAFDKKKTDARKEWLLESSANPAGLEVNYGSIQTLTVNDFVHKDMVHFSLADLQRSIAHTVDGFKPSQRKVMYAVMSKKWSKNPRVAQLASFTQEATCYHHGETSLTGVITNLAQDFVGSNNMNFLFPDGQFGTRLQGGKDAAASRYIHTCPTESAMNMFVKEDNEILTYLEEDETTIEPEYYIPVLPNVLINGTEGIGTGFSCYVPPFNPVDIKNNIERLLKNQNMITMKPWFRGFKGVVEQGDDEQTWTMDGVWKMRGDSCVVITELPAGRWTQDYKEYLDTLVEKKTISGFLNNSTIEDVNFEVYDYKGTNLVKDLKLCKTIHASNMHLFHPSEGIKKYNYPEEILVDFMGFRLEAYQKRKKNILKKFKKEQLDLQNKCRFIEHVVNDKIIIFKQKKSSIEQVLERMKFNKCDNSYDYLLRIPTYQYTEEEIEKINKKLNQLLENIQVVRETTTIDMWKSDLKKIN